MPYWSSSFTFINLAVSLQHLHVRVACPVEHGRTTISWAALAWHMASGTLTLSAPYTQHVERYLTPNLSSDRNEPCVAATLAA